MKYRSLAAAQVLSVFALLLLMMAIYDVSAADVKSAIFSHVFLWFFLFILASEILRSVRLRLVIKMISPSGKVSILSCLYARLVANLAGLFTPSSIGSVPAQTAVLSSRSPLPIEVYVGAGLLTSMVDAGTAALINILFFRLMERYSIAGLVSSIAVLIAWVAGVYFFIFNEPFFRGVLRRLYARFDRLAKRAHIVDYRAYTFREGIRLALLNLKASLLSLSLGAASYLLIGWAICYIIGHDAGALFALYLGANTQVLGLLPTPGGSGFYELGLAEVLSAPEAISVRVSLILIYSAMGLMSMLIVTRNPREAVHRLKRSLTAGMA